MLNAGNEQPLYIQLKKAIQSAIQNRTLKEGGQIPTETELSRMYSVSRITVRKAVAELVQEGYLVKRQGKGTFVNTSRADRKISHAASFSAACQASGLPSQSFVTERKLLKADHDTAERLRLHPGDQVLYIQRKRYAGGLPLMLENNYFDYSRFAFLMHEPLDGSLYDLLRTKYQIDPGKPGETILKLALADEQQANLLEIPIGEALFYMRTVICDQNNQPVHTGKQYFIGGRYQFLL
ncbi:GntR family transcriptional regulator [Paenibacillus sp. CN-4]|uniref:GntR family transcriptional regulator n=1 Tax=Paenibacillus nanchangensis TaxID=3348343 RepID=UPI00397C318D